MSREENVRAGELYWVTAQSPWREVGGDFHVAIGEGEREGSWGVWIRKQVGLRSWNCGEGGSYSGSWPRARGQSQGGEQRLESSGPLSNS